jgi:hypothetical protein
MQASVLHAAITVPLPRTSSSSSMPKFKLAELWVSKGALIFRLIFYEIAVDPMVTT